MSATIRRILTAMLAACALLMSATTTASALPPSLDEQPYEVGLFYGDFDRDILLFAGAPAEDFCTDNLPTVDARVLTRRDGSTVTWVHARRQPLYLYSSPIGAPELIDATCQAMFDGDPDTTPLQPFAVGAGGIRDRIVVAPDGTAHVNNVTIGRATAVDGTTWRVRGWADLTIVDGVPLGDPADFQGLTATSTGS